MKKTKGFTLIELLAVIVILGILLSISVVAVNSIRKKQDKQNKENVISSILTGAKRYMSDNQYSSKNVEVETLINDDYVDFDTNKYKDLYGVSVSYDSCGSSSKLEYSIIVDRIKYSDCGCEQQSSNNTSKRICNDGLNK